MGEHTCNICNICNKDFKYKSHLQRHQECKLKCKNNNPSNSSANNTVATTPVATTPVATIPVATTPVTNIPVATIPVATIPVATIPVATNIPTVNIPVTKNTKSKNTSTINSNKNNLTTNEFYKLKQFIKDVDINDYKLEVIYALLKDELIRKADEPSTTNNIFKCYGCNKVFAHKQGLHKHIRLNRCKKNEEIINNIYEDEDDNISISSTIVNNNLNVNDDLNNNVNDKKINKTGITFNELLKFNNEHNNTVNHVNNVNTVINNTNTNNTNIDNSNNIFANIAININAFGCESLEHISVNDFKYIFKDINNIINKLCYHIFKRHIPNISFYKNNLNKKIVSYLNKNMEITKISEKQFIVNLKYLLQDLCIELFYMFKNQLSHQELLKYMKNLISHQNLLGINNGKNVVSQEVTDAITNLLDDAFRNNDIKIAIEAMIAHINSNKKIKNTVITKNTTINDNKVKIIKEYEKANKNNKDSKNLYNLKIKAEETLKVEEDKTAKQNMNNLIKNINFDKLETETN